MTLRNNLLARTGGVWGGYAPEKLDLKKKIKNIYIWRVELQKRLQTIPHVTHLDETFEKNNPHNLFLYEY